jgi:ribonuclease J
MSEKPELAFLPLGGVGEIGMNCTLYGLGAGRRPAWLMIDLGVTFPTDLEPGVDVILPNIDFIAERADQLAGIILTHGHEDHIGALAELWPRLRAPVYATPFTAALLSTKIEEAGHKDFPLRIVGLDSRFEVGPFDVELFTLAHSIPEPSAVLIRTEAGSVLHTGDWKVDPTPMTSAPTGVGRLPSALPEGVDVLVCDSTNAVRDGVSPSEADVARTLEKLIAKAKHRVAVTTFASNVARIAAVAAAAEKAGRRLCVVGRAMFRVIEAAQETGYLPHEFKFMTDEEYGYLARDEVVALLTGSQGEPRAALSRVAMNEHPHVTLSPGDAVIFSSRTIPGNEKSVGRIQNLLSRQGVELITDQDDLVHVSGHPRRGELAEMYRWTRPRCLVPVHGEDRHLEAHARFAEAQGVPRVVRARNGDIVRLLPDEPAIVDRIETGRILRDGRILVDAEEGSLRERRKLAILGAVSVAIALDRRGELVSDPDVALVGVPETIAKGERDMIDVSIDAALGAVNSIPRARRKDIELVREAVRRSVRAAVAQAWGKKPVCNVLVSLV